MSTLPQPGPYNERRYLADALVALWHKVRHEQNLYWPPYHGLKVRWSWATAIEWVVNAALIVGLFLLVGVLAMR